MRIFVYRKLSLLANFMTETLFAFTVTLWSLLAILTGY